MCLCLKSVDGSVLTGDVWPLRCLLDTLRNAKVIKKVLSNLHVSIALFYEVKLRIDGLNRRRLFNTISLGLQV